MNESDLVAAAASTMAALGGPIANSTTGTNGNEKAHSPSSGPLPTPSGPTLGREEGIPSAAIPASALLLGGLATVDEEDNYD